MFKCESCGRLTGSREKMFLVYEYRDKEYATKLYGKKVKTSMGIEAISEKKVCDECYSKISKKEIVNRNARKEKKMKIKGVKSYE